MLMIESPEGVENTDEILQVPGIGAIHIGASDLGVSLGVGPPSPGNPPGTEAAVQKVLRACLETKVVCGYPAVFGGEAEVRQRFAEGFKILQISGTPPAGLGPR
jgi:4-hydroxy-2-oxoheptanedioate aldolase